MHAHHCKCKLHHIGSIDYMQCIDCFTYCNTAHAVMWLNTTHQSYSSMHEAGAICSTIHQAKRAGEGSHKEGRSPPLQVTVFIDHHALL